MTIEAPHTTGLFAELLEGAKALAERPTLIAEAERAKSEAAFHQSRLDTYRQQFDEMQAKINQLTDELAAKEAALAQATFQHKEVGDKLSLILGAVKGVVGEIGAAVSLVEPEAEAPKSEQGPSAMDPKETDTSATDIAGSHSSDPTTAPSVLTASSSTGADTAPTGDGTTVSHGSPELDADAAKLQSMGADPGPTLQDMGLTSEAARTDSPLAPSVASSTDDPSGPAPSMSNTPAPMEQAPNTSADPSAIASPPKLAFWQKPARTTWEAWRDAGNEVPPWYEQNVGHP